MSKWDRLTHHYYGKGVVLFALRDANGNAKGFTPLGDCPEMTFTIETQVIEQIESQTGQNLTSARTGIQTTGRVSMRLLNWSSDVLALALRGTLTNRVSTAVSGQAVKLYNGKVASLGFLNLSSVTVSRGVQALTAYVDDATAYDYKLNAENGSIKFNNGSIVAIDKLTTGGTAPTVIGVGSTTTVTVANTASAGDYVAFTGFAGADAALINGKMHKILSATTSQVVIDLNTTGKTITLGTPLSAFDGVSLAANFTYGAQNQIDGFTQAEQSIWLLFEGLNKADSTNPFNVDLFKVMLDPPAELNLINQGQEHAPLNLSGSLLADTLRTSGSQWFREMQVR